jgi:hypothetical protein
MQLLILAHALDSGAQAVARSLVPLLDYRLTVMRPELLGQANWSRRMDAEGRTHTQLCWRNGRRMDSSQIGMVWNRTRLLPATACRLGSPQDRNFVGAELHGLVLSWLSNLEDRVEPSIRRHATVTPLERALNWAGAAVACGLTLATDFAKAETFSVLHTPLGLWGNGRVEWPAPLLRACQALSDELGFALLQLGFQGTPEAPRLARVDAHPALHAPGEVYAVASWLAHSFDSSLKAEPILLP